MRLINAKLHFCKIAKTNNGQIIHNLALISKIKILLLLATVIDKPKYFILTGFILGLYDNVRKGRNWIKKIPYKSHVMDSLSKNSNLAMLEGVHKKIYPYYASRMKN